VTVKVAVSFTFRVIGRIGLSEIANPPPEIAAPEIVVEFEEVFLARMVNELLSPTFVDGKVSDCPGVTGVV
jgi:hypothetical protein